MKPGAVLAAILALALVLAGALSLFGPSGRFTKGDDMREAARELPAAVEAYRATGLPWVAADLAPKPPVPDDENAAPLLREGARAMVAKGWGKALPAVRRAADEGRWTDLDRALAGYAPALKTLVAASNRPRVDFRRDWDLAGNILLPEYAGIRGGVQALALRARSRAAQGDPMDALADLAAVRRIAFLTAEDPFLIAALVRIGSEATLFREAQRMGAETPALAAPLRALLASPEPPHDLVHVLRSEAYLAVASARNITRFYPLDSDVEFESLADPKRVRRGGFPEDESRRALMARALQLWVRADAEIRRHRDDPLALGRALDRLGDAERRKRGESYRLSARLLPEFTLSGAAMLKIGAEREITLAYLAALDARRRTGALPKTLISGADPFGHPYRSERKGDGFRLWWLGLDGKDQKGASKREDPKSDDVSAVFPPRKR